MLWREHNGKGGLGKTRKGGWEVADVEEGLQFKVVGEGILEKMTFV